MVKSRAKKAFEYLEEYEHFRIFMPHNRAIAFLAGAYEVKKETFERNLAYARELQKEGLTEWL
ncbi:hypothetical protein [Corynebacterium accolens]|uniref:hypothetical protein n=1 Tax=Corynebacterium accolens TaxID=38284 RepID=UPI0026708BB2|nr:hypothetical protein [Corynebacterium accolens]WKS54938.1 hypothetical protein NLL31_06815 [Corynebacterium accolens]